MANNGIKLEEIVPKGSKFKLKQTGKEYRLRPFSLADEVWLQEEFGDDIQKIFEEIRMKEISRIVFHQMEPETQRQFKSQKVTIMNEEGDETEIKLGGAKLLFAMIEGINEKIAIFNALMETIGVSRPIIDKLTAVDSKKKSQQTGRK